MKALRQNISLIIAALLAVVFHVMIVPALAIASICPNALLAFCVVLSIVRPTNASMVVSFLLGLLGGALSSQPLGILAAVMVLISFVLVQVFSVLDGNSQFMAALCIALAVLISELVYGFLLVQCGMNVSFFGLLVYRCLPCALYDCVLAYLMYPLVHRFVGPLPAATHIPVAQQLR